jgi:hypothetical protein
VDGVHGIEEAGDGGGGRGGSAGALEDHERKPGVQRARDAVQEHARDVEAARRDVLLVQEVLVPLLQQVVQPEAQHR